MANSKWLIAEISSSKYCREPIEVVEDANKELVIKENDEIRCIVSTSSDLQSSLHSLLDRVESVDETPVRSVSKFSQNAYFNISRKEKTVKDIDKG